MSRRLAAGRALARLGGTVALAQILCVVGATAQSASLEQAARRFADAWDSGDAAALASTLRSESVVVDLQGENHGSVAASRAASALGRFLGRYESRSTEVTRASDVGGSPKKGFAEVRWRAVVPGTTEVLTYTVFAGLMMEGGAWRVSEVRVLR